MSNEGAGVGLLRRIAEHLATVDRATSRMVAEALAHDLQAITPRLAELRRLGVVELAGTLANPTGKNALAVRLTENGEAWLRGAWAPVEVDGPPSRRLALERLLTRVATVTRVKETRDGFVLVPMQAMVELGAAEQRFREARHRAIANYK